MSYAAFRNGMKTHLERPRANERAARLAWDVLSRHGEIVSMKLLDGYWMCDRPDGSLDDVEASIIRQHVANGWKWGESPGIVSARSRSETKAKRHVEQ